MKQFYFLNFNKENQPPTTLINYLSEKKLLKSFLVFLFLGMSVSSFGQETQRSNSQKSVQKTMLTPDTKKNINPAVGERKITVKEKSTVNKNEKSFNKTNKNPGLKASAKSEGKISKEGNKSGKTTAAASMREIKNSGGQIENSINEKRNPKVVDVSVSDNQSPFESVKGKKEDVSKRDLYSKTYQNEDGSFTALIGAGPIHYQKNGQFLDIDHKITQNFDQTYPFVNATNLFQSYFGATSHTGLKNKTDDGELREFLNTKMFWEVNGQPYGLINSANTPIQIEGDKAYYRNIYGNIDVEFTMLTGKRELNYIIPNQAALGNIPENATYLVFSEDVVLPIGWTHEVTDKGIVIKNTLGQSVYLYSNPVSKDAKETLFLSKENNTIYETRLIGNTLTVLTKVKTEWLLSSERVFPVLIDPTNNYYPDNSIWWTGYVQSNYTGGNDNMRVGRNNENRISGFSKYNLSTLPNESTINSVYSWQYYSGRQGEVTNRQFTLGNITVDPVVASWYEIYTSTTQLVTDFAWSVSNSPYGWIDMELNANGRTHVQNSITQNWVAICLYVNGLTGNYETPNYHIFAGYSNEHRPYLVIDYTVPSGCSGTPDAGEVAVGSHVDNPGQQYVVVAIGYSQGTGIEYKWQKRTSVNYGAWSVWSDVTSYNSTYSSYIATAPAAGTREEWRLQVRCTNGNNIANSTTDVFYASDCYQGDGFELDPEDGYGITSSSNFRVADDFVVPQYSSFSIRTITMDVFTFGTVTNATLNIRKDDGGLPGSVVATRTMTPTRIMRWGDFLGIIPWYRISFDLATSINLGTGTYWLEPTVTASGNNTVYWATTYGTTGGVAALSNDSGATWIPDYDEFYDMVFFVVGDCFSCPSVTATANRYSVCEGEEVTLSASTGESGYTYHWYIGYDNSDGTYDEDLGTGQTKTLTVEESTSYWVVATSSNGCEDYTYVTVMVTPPPTLIVMDPIESISCSDETREIKVVSGGIIPETILDETWNPISNPWIVSTQTWGGAGPDYARWALYASGTSFHSPDNSNFVMVDSFAYGPYEMQSSLISPPMSLIDYNSPTTNITLTFNHHYLRYLSSEEAKVEVTTDGTNWTTIQSYTSTQGDATEFAAASIDLNAYKGAPYFQIRFRYHANGGFYWAIDDIKITGTNPLPTTITWSPIAGLWFDEDMTLPYDGSHAATLYASPSSTTTYTISASTSVGCPSVEQVTVKRGDKNWISPSSTDWNIAANWNEGGIPTIDHCVKIPGSGPKPIIDGTTDGFAKNVTIANGGGLTIREGGSLTVDNYIKNNNPNGDTFILESDANLIQFEDSAPNIGSMTVEKKFLFSTGGQYARRQYNFLTVPVVDVNKIIKSTIYSPYDAPLSLQQYNEGDYYFYETDGPYVSGKGYAVQESPNAPQNGKGTFKGEIFNGILNYQLKLTAGGYNLVGNPYPSNLDVNLLYNNNSANIFPTFYFWDNRGNEEMYQQGSSYNGDSYAKYNALNETGVTASAPNAPNPRIPTKDVKVGTGFMVQARNNNVNLHFENNYRTKDGSVGYFGKPSGFTGERDRYWLTMTAPSEMTVMNAVVYFDGGKDDFWIDDTESFGPSDDLFTIVEDKQLAIQGKSPFNDFDKVPLGYKAFEDGYYFIQIFDQEGVFAEGQMIYILDKQLNKLHNLSNNGAYKFLTRHGEFTNRFEILYRPFHFWTNSETISNQIDLVKKDNQIVISSSIDKITEVEVFDLNSRSVYKKTGVNSKEHSLSALNFNHQIIVVTVKTDKGEFVTKKFVNN